MRRLTYLAAIIMLVSAPAAPAWAKAPRIIQTVETTAGEVVFFKLPGNPSAGYNWKLNKRLSTGLDLVKVDQLGWLLAQKGKNFFIQEQSVQNIAVWAKTSGQADLAFDYFRKMGGRRYTRTSIVRVIIKPRLAAQ